MLEATVVVKGTRGVGVDQGSADVLVLEGVLGQ